jgi:hypothetical protein
VLWAIGRAVTAAGSRRPAAAAPSRHYLAGRVHGVRITVVVAYEDELLAGPDTGRRDDRVAGVFQVTGDRYCRARVQRWHRESARLRGYFGENGAIMLADPVLGGNAACEPAAATTRHHHHPPGSEYHRHHLS